MLHKISMQNVYLPGTKCSTRQNTTTVHIAVKNFQKNLNELACDFVYK